MVEKTAHVTELNLARKWRSQQFDEIVGQELSVRMLKNSLYLGHYFPVYLFSGQRGCGKTTTARVFAAAVNCEQLSVFQKNPKTVLPCRSCASCIAMQKGKHPDFMEIDAASHTGVDNMRSLIDSSSLMPLLGTKKIYLIDEAHMLSKAAFNALLKILEEPPASVLFILATTDPQKILETVKSRCFQLFFCAIDSMALQKHLSTICESEEIPFDTDALELIIKQAQGSARDAINLIEQVRFANGAVTKTAVAQVLGHLTDDALMKLFSLLMQRKPKQLLSFLSNSLFYQSNALYVWQKMLELLRCALWLKYNVQQHDETIDYEQLAVLVKNKSINELQYMMQLFYDNESIFLKTINQHSFLEMIFLQLCTVPSNTPDDGRGGANSNQAAVPFVTEEDDELCDEDEEDEEYEDEEDEEEEEEDATDLQRWNLFVQQVTTLDDPLLTSVFQQGTFANLDVSEQQIQITFAKDFVFFADWLNQTQSQWLPLLHRAFSANVQLIPSFTGESKAVLPERKPASATSVSQHQSMIQKNSPPPKRVTPTSYRSSSSTAPKAPKGSTLDVSDAAHWKKANLIVRYFPGTVIELTEQ